MTFEKIFFSISINRNEHLPAWLALGMNESGACYGFSFFKITFKNYVEYITDYYSFFLLLLFVLICVFPNYLLTTFTAYFYFYVIHADIILSILPSQNVTPVLLIGVTKYNSMFYSLALGIRLQVRRLVTPVNERYLLLQAPIGGGEEETRTRKNLTYSHVN